MPGDFDFRVIEAGFNVLPELEARRPSDGHFIARTLEGVLGQKFAPDQNLAKYEGEHGLTKAFFSDTSRNALSWCKAQLTQRKS